jgi:hypothetical protein
MVDLADNLAAELTFDQIHAGERGLARVGIRVAHVEGIIVVRLMASSGRARTGGPCPGHRARLWLVRAGLPRLRSGGCP